MKLLKFAWDVITAIFRPSPYQRRHKPAGQEPYRRKVAVDEAAEEAEEKAKAKKAARQDGPFKSEAMLEYVRTANFGVRPVMNRFERQKWGQIMGQISGKGYVFPQMAMGGFLKPDGKNAFRSINSKRVDFLITDKTGRPVAAVECQGKGHYKGDWEKRARVKREALERAGVSLIEIFPKDKRKDIAVKLAPVKKALKSPE